MAKSSADKIAQQISALSQKVDKVGRTPQLANSSIENGNLKVKDAAGTTTMVFGQQFDGTAGAVVVNGPTPPVPSVPTVTSMTGGIKVAWDGSFPDQNGFTKPVVAPLDFARVEVHVSTGSSFSASAATKKATIESPGGGEVFVGWDVPAPVPPAPPVAGTTTTPPASTNAVVLYARLVVVSKAGKSSAASAIAGPVSATGAAKASVANDQLVMIQNLQALVNSLQLTVNQMTTTNNALLQRVTTLESQNASQELTINSLLANKADWGHTHLASNIPSAKGNVQADLDWLGSHFP